MPALLRWGRGLRGLSSGPAPPRREGVGSQDPRLPPPLPVPQFSVLAAGQRPWGRGGAAGRRKEGPRARLLCRVPRHQVQVLTLPTPPPAPFPVSFPFSSQAVTLGVGARPSPAPRRWTGHDTDSPSSSFSDTWWQRTCRPRPSFSRGQDPRAARPPGLLASADGGLRVTASPGR